MPRKWFVELTFEFPEDVDEEWVDEFVTTTVEASKQEFGYWVDSIDAVYVPDENTPDIIKRLHEDSFTLRVLPPVEVRTVDEEKFKVMDELFGSRMDAWPPLKVSLKKADERDGFEQSDPDKSRGKDEDAADGDGGSGHKAHLRCVSSRRSEGPR